MLSKEEIEKDIRTLKNISECFTYSMWTEDTEALRRVLQYIDQLQSDKQKLIEKLEEDIKKFKEQNADGTLQDYLEETLKILKGEKNDRLELCIYE